MALFSSKPQSFLGVDLGIGSIKLVELKNENNRARLVTYAFTEQIVNIVKGDLEENKKEVAELLKKICVKAKTSTTVAITALPLSEIFSSIISLSNIEKGDLASKKILAPIIEREAAKITPIPANEMLLDWKILDFKEKESVEGEGGEKILKNVKILLTGAAKSLIGKYMDIFKLANLNLSSLETESFALIRSLVGNDKSTIVIIDLGVTKTNITVVSKGVPFLIRSINVGGQLITRALGENLNISPEQAEQLKSDIGIPLKKEGGEKIPQIIESILAPIISEIKYCLEIYKTENNQTEKDIDKIILCGGGALMPNFAPYLSNVLNMRVYVGDPWARVICPEGLKPVLEEIGPRFAVSIGLAMREIE
jgi:type IV pilus assembly protein PilM